MRIKHYDTKLLSEIRLTFSRIRELIDVKSRLSLEARSVELQIDDPRLHKAGDEQAILNEINSRITENQSEIDSCLEWLSKHAPHVMKRLDMISPFVDTWGLDWGQTIISQWSIAFSRPTSHYSSPAKFSGINLSIKNCKSLKLRATQSRKKRYLSVKMRWIKMTDWYRFFCGEVPKSRLY